MNAAKAETVKAKKTVNAAEKTVKTAMKATPTRGGGTGAGDDGGDEGDSDSGQRREQGIKDYPDISIDDLDKAIKSGKVAIIDVNGAKSYAKGHIPGAISFSDSASLAKQLRGIPKEMLVVYAGGPKDSVYKRAAIAAEELGFTNVKYLSAGISGWIKAGNEVEKSRMYNK